MAEREAISKGLRFRIFQRDKFTCQYCGAHGPDAVLVVDHIHPVAAGGSNKIGNLATACRPCNAGKSARLLDSAPLGGSWRDPLDFPPIARIQSRQRLAPLPLKDLTNEHIRICELVADAESRAFLRYSRELDRYWSVADSDAALPEEDDDYDRRLTGSPDWDRWGRKGEPA